MTLADLATTGDLDALGVDTSDATLIAALLASASSAVRDAAGCSITSTTGTVTIGGNPSPWLTVPGWAVTTVSAVTIDGEAVTDWKLIDGRLWRSGWWADSLEPSAVAITYTQGVASAPADIVNLVASLVAAGVARSADGYDPMRGVSSERIDDYQRSFTRGDDEVVAPMELPSSTRAWLRSRFGSGVSVTGELR